MHLVRNTFPRSNDRAALAIIGVGNGLRGDDAVGLEVARGLFDLAAGHGVAVHPLDGDCLRLLDRWAGTGTALIVDASRSERRAGSIAELDASATALPVDLRLRSSHAFGVAQAIELARALGTLPPTVLVYAIEGRSFAYGDGLTPAVATAAGVVGRRIRERVRAAAAHTIRDARSTSRLE